ncbi:Sodium/hydrogen exchanger family protein [Citreimonas salinaria]|uniref:Sodium/hydrogen exchanger family protein n=2 Tax=Citreimonas salinaria TaxID=321339 RepID=A0A1H3M284_9RHOB|nr:Sodium/hydrogen exchanger family protein [Citreimonas salinaria]
MAAMFAAVGDIVGLDKEVGGLLAGVALASTPYRETIAARLAPLRDFLLLFFFIALGSALDLSLLGTHVAGAIIFSLFVLIGNPLIVLVGHYKITGPPGIEEARAACLDYPERVCAYAWRGEEKLNLRSLTVAPRRSQAT